MDIESETQRRFKQCTTSEEALEELLRVCRTRAASHAGSQQFSLMRPVTRGWARSRADPDPVECGPLSSPKTPRCRSKQPYVEVQSCCYGAQLRAHGRADLLARRGILNPAIIRFLEVVFDQIGHTAHLYPCICAAPLHAHHGRVVELSHAGDDGKLLRRPTPVDKIGADAETEITPAEEDG